MSIFKAYDIRGVYPAQINEEFAYKLGRAFVAFTNATQVLAGYDARLSSESIFASLVKGIIDQGAVVVDIGLCTTPMINFLNAHFNYETSIMVTASHNPKKYNGFKMNAKNVTPLTGDTGIMDIKKIIEEKNYPLVDKKGGVSKKDHFQEYVNFLAGLVKEDITNLKPVIDGSSGPVGRICKAVMEKLKVDFVPLNFEPDGNFPSHDPNPLKGDSQDSAKKLVIEKGADFGCLFDADADRIIFVDEMGKTVSPDFIGALLAKKALQEKPGGKVLYDCISSKVIQKAVADYKGEAVVSRVGRSYIYLTAKKEKVVLGSEASSHYYHPEVYYSDSGLLTLLKIMEIMVKENKKFSELVKPFDVYFHSGEINIEVGDKDTAIERIAETFGDGKQSRLDGIGVEYEDVWFTVRKSNTEPLLRIRIEAKTKAVLEEYKEKILEIVKKKKH